MLAHSMSEMKSSLRSFQKFVPADVVKDLVASAIEARLGGKRATLTLFFSDVADFTAMAEGMEPEALVSHIGEYLGEMSRAIHAQGGIGEVWVAPDMELNREVALKQLQYEHADHRPSYPFQHLEKRYFDVGNLGFGAWRGFGGVVGMCICNDRRWPETYRVLGLQGVELVMLGYNTPSHVPWMPVYDHLTGFHNHLVMQSGAYQNSTFVIGVAKAGLEEGCDLAGGSCIIAPSGEIVAQAVSKADELIVARCDLDLALQNKRGVLNFANREPEYYKLITERRTAVVPD